jgi:hypothetical protein
MKGIQEYDIVGKRRADGRYDIWQVIADGDQRLAGPVPRERAETLALELAKEHHGDAWIEELPGSFRYLAP